MCGIFLFQFRFIFFIKSLYFYSTKRLDCLTLKRHNYFENQNNRNLTHSFAPSPLIFKLQQEV